MNKKYVKYGLIGVLCLVVVSGIFLKFYSSKESSASDAMQYVETQVQRGAIQVTASGTGSIQASVRKEITTLDDGIVDKIYVEEGQSVNEGDLILTFENDTENTTIESAKLNVKMAENDLSDLEDDLKNLKIYAQASGVVDDVDVDIGDELSKGELLTTITNKSILEAVGKFNKAQIKNIQVGDSADILLLGSFQTLSGKVTKVGEVPGDNNGAVLYDVTVEVENPGGLTSGLAAQITVNNDKGSFIAVEDTSLETKSPVEVELSIGGTLKNLYISSGDYVEKGELLAELESTDLQIQIENQKIKLEQSKLDLSEKLEDLDNTAVYAPISGTITVINVTEGEQVKENTAVAVVSDLQNLEVVIPIDELDIINIEEGQPAVVTVGAVPEMNYDAQVSDIALEGTISGGVATFDVTLSLSDATYLKPGMSANAEIIASSKENTLILPIEAIQQIKGKKYVITEIKDDKPQLTPVEIGLVSEDLVEITSGLDEGATVFYRMSSGTSSSNEQRMPGMGMMGIGGGAPPQGAPGQGGRR